MLYNYNYNILIYEKIDFRKEILLQLFLKNFPKKFQVAETKKKLKQGKVFYTFKSPKTFLKNEYVYYNKFTFNFLIIDIDTKIRGIREIIELLDEHFIAPPTWICETTNGYQVAFALEKPFLINSETLSEKDKILKKYAANMLKNMHELLGGDPESLRLQGFYKNPIYLNLDKFKLFVTQNKFNLSDFDIILPKKNKLISKNKKAPNAGNAGGDFHKNPQEIKILAQEFLCNFNLNILNQINIGERNSFLWYIGMFLSKETDDWIDRLYIYNLNLKEPIKEEELSHIIKSIENYNRQNKNFVGGYNTFTKENKNNYMKEYRLKKGIHKQTREQQKEENKTKVIKAIYELKSKKEKLTIRNIAKQAKLSKNVTNKYVKELKEDSKFKVLFD